MNNGQQTMGNRQWTVDNGQMDNEQQTTMDNGQHGVFTICEACCGRKSVRLVLYKTITSVTFMFESSVSLLRTPHSPWFGLYLVSA